MNPIQEQEYILLMEKKFGPQASNNFKHMIENRDNHKISYSETQINTVFHIYQDYLNDLLKDKLSPEQKPFIEWFKSKII